VEGPDFFVSYGSGDRAWAEWIAWELEEAGFRTRLRPWDFGLVDELQRTSEEARAVVAVISDRYPASLFPSEELEATRDRPLLAVFLGGVARTRSPVAEPLPARLLGSMLPVDLTETSEDEARKRLREAAERVLSSRAKPAAAPAFPRPAADRPVSRPARFPALAEYVSVTLDLRVGDVLDEEADLVAFKYADGFHGADLAAARRLMDHGAPVDEIPVARGEARLMDARSALGANVALFIGVGPLGDLSYDGVRTLARRAVEIAHRERARHLAMTLHGGGIGLDERESFLAQVAGFLEALQELRGASAVERITIVDRAAGRIDVCGATLREHLGEIPQARLERAAPGEFSFRVGAGRPQLAGYTADEPEAIDLLDRSPEAQPHIFVAYPFKLEDHARYGIAQPANEAGFLTRLINDQAWTGEIMQRIRDQIEQSVLVVGVLTGANPNVCLEVGYAWGKGRPTVLVADDPETLPFDVRGHRVIGYDSIHDLERKFASELAALRQSNAF